ncbi:MAG: dihydroorotase [Candidatus Aenigmarchaeota archaeon]|nr:dihydroorotase [Candidatus Aenigmarchaeota archaeon]
MGAYIDPHVHLRDGRQAHKETIRHGLLVAYDSNVAAILDMPNTDPAVTTREVVEDRLRLARDAGVPGVFYGLFMGATADPEQLREAVEVCREVPQVVGLKLYAGTSVGDLAVIREEDQRRVYAVLAAAGYDGVLAVHCEKESHFRPVWTPDLPASHCLARPEEAEVASVRDQLAFSREEGYRGKLHIAHVSSPQAVELVAQAREGGMDVSSGVCPHHLVYDWRAMEGEAGIRMKMNPPLRSPASRLKLLEQLHAGKIDWIETDHAPHTLDEKTNPQRGCPSGVPGLAWWPLFEEFLRRQEFSGRKIGRLTFTNAAERFGLDLQAKEVFFVDHRAEYAFDPYVSLEREIGWPPRY